MRNEMKHLHCFSQLWGKHNIAEVAHVLGQEGSQTGQTLVVLRTCENPQEGLQDPFALHLEYLSQTANWKAT